MARHNVALCRALEGRTKEAAGELSVINGEALAPLDRSKLVGNLALVSSKTS